MQSNVQAMYALLEKLCILILKLLQGSVLTEDEMTEHFPRVLSK